ncbi:PREDICTED: uncharacterized protein LOC108365907 [Rhagoletis zephyria]|uniref:uncharacterized protein LOC108365907 n=1 Tax=Rhagoletis zephyria TaxID=28612 RepID=UPI0008112574|nr:PREDICTED: uncharacterized protein LOC108365907 [Rhagoletis zephyria]
MQDPSAQVPSALNVPAVRFDASKDFQKRSLTYERDRAFARTQRKTWVRSSGERRSNREALTTLLSSHGDNSGECIEKLLAEEISYRDLASLSSADLELMGFKNSKEREDLLAFFAELPNQDPSYKSICGLVEAETYNGEIVSNAIDHLENMRSALRATNYKLKIMPPDDIVVGEKSFASRFVLEALTELQTVTGEIDKEVADLTQLLVEKQSSQKVNRTAKNRSFASVGVWALLCTVAAASALAAVYLTKMMKH